jgi:hypothetical protein
MQSVFRFHRPRGAEQQTPGVAVTEALRHLGERRGHNPKTAKARIEAADD